MRTHSFRTAAAVRHVRRHHLSDLPAVFGKWLEPGLARLKGRRNRLFNPPRTVWMFLGQVMAGNCSCKEILQKTLAWLFAQKGEKASSDTGGYCKARKRLKTPWMEDLQSMLVSTLQSTAGDRGLWQGRSVRIVDGSSVSMPDTPANQKRYPQPDGQKKGCGFPVLRLTRISHNAVNMIALL